MLPRFETIWVYQFRVVLLGDSTVGKSALLRRFTDGCFIEISDPTVGVDFYSRLVEVSPGTRVKLQLWDTAGQERFRFCKYFILITVHVFFITFFFKQC